MGGWGGLGEGRDMRGGKGEGESSAGNDFLGAKNAFLQHMERIQDMATGATMAVEVTTTEGLGLGSTRELK